MPHRRGTLNAAATKELGFDSKRECRRFVKRNARRGCRPERDSIGRHAFREKYGRCEHHGRALHNCVEQAIGAG